MFSMVRTLLEDRFTLKYHTETKKLSVSALVVAKNGLILSNANEQPCIMPLMGQPLPMPDSETPKPVCASAQETVPWRRQAVWARHPNARVTQGPREFSDRTVIDKADF